MAYTFYNFSSLLSHGEAGTASFIDSFWLGTGDGMPWRDKIAPYLDETFFLFWLMIAL